MVFVRDNSGDDDDDVNGIVARRGSQVRGRADCLVADVMMRWLIDSQLSTAPRLQRGVGDAMQLKKKKHRNLIASFSGRFVCLAG